jgi:hypothetical protein
VGIKMAKRRDFLVLKIEHRQISGVLIQGYSQPIFIRRKETLIIPFIIKGT